MRKLLFSLLTVMCCMTVAAQNGVNETNEEADTVLSGDMDKTLKAWLALNEAVVDSDYAAMRIAADSLRRCNAEEFSTLRTNEDSTATLDGHIVFDEVFADSIAAGADVILNSGEYSAERTTRGQTSDGSVKTKTVLVKRGQSTICRFNAKGHQELAVAAEAGGLITMKIRVTNSAGLDERYDDTKDVKKGRNYRKAVFEMPKDKRNVVTLEIVNCCDKDISVVVISN